MLIDNYKTLYDFFIDFDASFTKDLGQNKTDEIERKIANSNTLKKLGLSMIESKSLVRGQTVIEAIMSTRHFMFSKKEVVLYASILGLVKILNDAALQEVRFPEHQMLQTVKEVLTSAKHL